MIIDPMLPLWLLALIAVVLVGYCAFAAARAPRGARALWAGRALLPLALVAALLRPGVGAVPIAGASTSLDVVFVVDLSASTSAEDWSGVQPRLEGMRADVAALAEHHAGARFALITFDSTAVQRLPFTTDASALGQAMRTLVVQDPDYASGTSIGAGAELLERVLRAAADRDAERMRVVYYLGDGEQTAEREPDDYADSAELVQGGSVLGYGTSRGGRMADPWNSGSYLQDRSGGVARSRIDEDRLRAVANELRVGYQLREAGSAPVPAEVDPARGVDLEHGTTTTFPLYWLPALVVVVWMLVEAGRLVGVAGELRRARGGGPA